MAASLLEQTEVRDRVWRGRYCISSNADRTADNNSDPHGCKKKKGVERAMRRSLLLILGGALLALAGYFCGNRTTLVVHAQSPSKSPSDEYPVYGPTQGTVPKAYGKVAAVIADQIGTGLVMEDAAGTIRFVSMTGMKEGELARYEGEPTHGGIPKSYGHLVGAVVNPKGTGLVFEDGAGVIRFVTITGKMEGELTRN